MIIVKTHELTPEKMEALSASHSYWIYNGLDCCVTKEVADVLKPMVDADPLTKNVYNFEVALQAPAVEMMNRGFKVDMVWRNNILLELESRAKRLLEIINRYAQVVWDKDLNPGSPKQMQNFFYNHMKMPVQYKKVKGQKKVSTDREALEKLQAYYYAKPIALAILAYRDVWKKHGALSSGVDADERMRCSFSVAGTETGRWSSSKNAFGTGTNFQNITPELRRAFVADEGYKLGYVDLEQAESRLVGLLAFLSSGATSYLDACESGDLHTQVCRMIWTGLPWTGELKKDKAVAETPFYRQFSYRDMSKRGGHGSNYYGKPYTMAKNLHIDTKMMEDFQEKYFHAFPEIPKWHQWTATQLQSQGFLITPMGRKRHFFGRLRDDATLREAIAFVPQSTIADYMNLGLYRVWRHQRLRQLGVKILAQIHDALVFLYRPEHEQESVETVRGLISAKLNFNGRDFSIPTDAKVGWNWAGYDKENNPHGLGKWNGVSDSRTEPQHRTALNSVLDRRVR